MFSRVSTVLDIRSHFLNGFLQPFYIILNFFILSLLIWILTRWGVIIFFWRWFFLYRYFLLVRLLGNIWFDCIFRWLRFLCRFLGNSLWLNRLWLLNTWNICLTIIGKPRVYILFSSFNSENSWNFGSLNDYSSLGIISKLDYKWVHIFDINLYYLGLNDFPFPSHTLLPRNWCKCDTCRFKGYHIQHLVSFKPFIFLTRNEFSEPFKRFFIKKDLF